MSDRLVIAVMSDLHAHTMPSDSAAAPSYLAMHADAQPTTNPIEGLRALIRDNGLAADMLLCAGDMGDKADHAAQNYAWEQVQRIGAALSAHQVIGTAGNHDMDSRYSSEFDAKGILQSLTPAFPGLSEVECDRYWSRNYVVHDEPRWRIVVLNSAAYHGGRRPKSLAQDAPGAEEYEHGRISDRTLAALRAELSHREGRAVNLLLCHHHPLRNDEVRDRDYSEMVGGDALINLLSSLNVGPWMIIHGHKHLPRVWYAGGNTGSTPVIFSAGSLSARLYPEIANRARNQFYLIELHLDAIREHLAGVLGMIQAWDWVQNFGWQPAGGDSGIPRADGFGWRENPERLAAQIASTVDDLLASSGAPFAPWLGVRAALPQVAYLNRVTLEQVKGHLKNKHRLVVLDLDGMPKQIGRADA